MCLYVYSAYFKGVLQVFLYKKIKILSGVTLVKCNMKNIINIINFYSLPGCSKAGTRDPL